MSEKNRRIDRGMDCVGDAVKTTAKAFVGGMNATTDSEAENEEPTAEGEYGKRGDEKSRG